MNSQPLMPLANDAVIAALDVGSKRIGIAVARMPAALPAPLTTLTNDENIWQQIQQLIKQEHITHLVIGLPRGLDGQETAQTRQVRQFAEEAAVRLQLPLALQDEAVTSVQAEAELGSSKKSYNKDMVDALAATYILEDYLREQRKKSA